MCSILSNVKIIKIIYSKLYVLKENVWSQQYIAKHFNL